MSYHVLLIDDDTLPMKYYVDYLKRRELTVKHLKSPDDALDYARRNADKIDLILLDIMLPPGTYGDEQTQQGLKTGVFLLVDLRKVCPNTPVVVLTNVRNPATLSAFGEGPLLKIAKKREYPPKELASLVEKMISKTQDLSRGSPQK